MKKIDLAQGQDEYPSPMRAETSAPGKRYPTFTYSGPDEVDLPDEGEMTIEFRKVASSKPQGGSSNHSCTIEVQKIVSVDPEAGEGADDTEPADEGEPTPPASNKSTESGSALDALMAAHMASKGK